MAKNAKSKKQEQKYESHEIEVTRAHLYQPKKGSAITFFDMEVNGVKVYGCKLMESKKGDKFVSWPSYKGSDDEYHNHVWVGLSEEDLEQIEKEVDELLEED